MEEKTPQQLTVEQTTSTTVETVQWFEALPGQTPPVEPKKKPIKLFILAGALVVLFGAAGAFFFVTQQAKACLTTDDLRELIGNNEVDEIVTPSDYFFTYQVDFQPGLASYDPDAETAGTDIIAHIAAFYTAHAEKSIVITLSGLYLSSNEESLTKERLSLVQSALTSAGIPANQIVTNNPTYYEPENASEQATSVTIAITSDASCQ